MKNKEKMNNKGFSLVELIIVIAIMVILVGVLAPVYTRYVESTRKSADVDALASIANAMEIVLIDNDARGNGSIIITATFDSNGTIGFTGAAPTGVTVPAATITAAVTEVTNTIGDYTLRGSWDHGPAGSFTAQIGANGNVVHGVNTSDVVTDIMAYSPAIDNKLNP